MNSSEKPRLRRSEVPGYLLEKHGIPIALATLNKMATTGGGPAMRYAGRIPLYDLDDLDRWAIDRLSQPVTSTSGRAA
ncbi:hypothetical protein [Rhizobium sp. NXC24]|uniref:hypothetical protein n=1 Tax=Rhizobium sp. NXC24 TaxID=2048897 RepID=UPI000CF234DE|nr:hypothetical protein [Rhizobium sp. NXC24]